VSSLNVSAAGAVVLFEAYRQRRNKLRGETRDKSGQTASKPRKLKGLGS
jgi:23S rRNA (guanosine2251-2'-O)-methyltransferase